MLNSPQPKNNAVAFRGIKIEGAEGRNFVCPFPSPKPVHPSVYYSTPLILRFLKTFLDIGYIYAYLIITLQT